jgi:hypothetical protein
MVFNSIYIIYSLSGQIYLKNTYFPSLSIPIGYFSKSMLTVPAKAKATTKGGDAKKFALVAG